MIECQVKEKYLYLCKYILNIYLMSWICFQIIQYAEGGW